ncbi:MAG TPA: hypothetical protein VGK64_05660 [Bryobacteraceae bacterium]
METSRIDSVALLAAIVALALAFAVAHGEFSYLTSIAGLSLLLVLFAYDRQGYRSGWQSLAFAAVAGLSLALAGAFVFVFYLHPARDILDKWLALTWLAGTFVFCVMDRVRMSSRVPASLGLTAGSVMPPPVTVSATPVFVPPATSRPPAPAPAAPAPAQSPAAAAPAPIPTAPAPAPVEEEVSAPPPVAPVLPTPIVPVSPPPSAIEAPAGKQTEIFVNLVGEGLNVLRRVRAEHMGRDYYRIVDEMPAGETWQFQPGQIVRCKKTKLSSGKGLVAFEEAPRAS